MGKGARRVRLESEIGAVKHSIDNLADDLNRLEQIERRIHKTRTTIYETKQLYAGNLPLTLFCDICQALGENPDGRFPPNLIEAEALNNSAERDILNVKPTILSQLQALQRKLRFLETMLQCVDAPAGSLDSEVFAVLEAAYSKEIEITTDEAVGMALANLYRRFGLFELSQRAVRGYFGLRETGNCVADAVFDPTLREKMIQRYKESGRWWIHSVLKQYLAIAECSDDYSTIRAYEIEYWRLRDLPSYILYGLAIIMPGRPGHVVRILDVRDDGLMVIEGNYDGYLNFGRFIPFADPELVEETTGRILVYSRQPIDRLGGQEALITYDYTNPDATGYDSIQESLDDLNSFQFFKLKSERQFISLPIDVRDSLIVLRFIVGKGYHIINYGDFVDGAPGLFPGHERKELIAAFVKVALSNPTGMIVAFAGGKKSMITSLLNSGRKLPTNVARQMYIYFDKEGGEEISLYECGRFLRWAKAQLLLLTESEFFAIEEDKRRELYILTPRKDHTGQHVDVDPHFEEQLFRIPPGSNNQCLLMEDSEGEIVSFADLIQNPLQALIVFGHTSDLIHRASRLSTEERKVLERYPIHCTKEQVRQILQRMVEIRCQHKPGGVSKSIRATAQEPKTVKKWWRFWK